MQTTLNATAVDAIVADIDARMAAAAAEMFGTPRLAESDPMAISMGAAFATVASLAQEHGDHPVARAKAVLVIARGAYAGHHLRTHGTLPATRAEADAHAVAFLRMTMGLYDALLDTDCSPERGRQLGLLDGPGAVALCLQKAGWPYGRADVTEPDALAA